MAKTRKNSKADLIRMILEKEPTLTAKEVGLVAKKEYGVPNINSQDVYGFRNRLRNSRQKKGTAKLLRKKDDGVVVLPVGMIEQLKAARQYVAKFNSPEEAVAMLKDYQSIFGS